MDDHSSAQLDLLVRVLSCLTLERDFKSLLTPENIREVIDHHEEFISQDISRLNFSGSTNALAREEVQSSLIERIKEGTSEEMIREDLRSRFPLISLTNPTLPLGAKWPRDAEHEFVSQLQRRVGESTISNSIGVPRTREGAKDPIISTEVRGPRAQPRGRVPPLEPQGDWLQ